MNLLISITLSIVASLSLMASPAAPAPVASGEQNEQTDAASLQKKATQAQARIHANKDDRDQMMMAVKTKGYRWSNKSSSETDSPLKIWKTRRSLYGQAEERQVKTKSKYLRSVVIPRKSQFNDHWGTSQSSCYGNRNQSTFFNRDWLASNHLGPDLPLESIPDR